jgi:hypothetical protein
MSRSTFSGPVNAGKKTITLVQDVTTANFAQQIPQVGTASLVQRVGWNAALTTASPPGQGNLAAGTYTTAIILPKNSKVLRVITQCTTTIAGASTINVSLGSTAGGVDYVAAVAVATTGTGSVPTARTLTSAFADAAQNPAGVVGPPAIDGLKVYVNLVVSAATWTAGQVDVLIEYAQFAGHSQTVVAPKV